MNISIKDTGYAVYVNAVKKFNEGKRPLAHVVSFGCQQNEADSERIRGMAAEMGYEISESYDGCDLIIVNTCAIREHAEMKALSLLGNFKKNKKSNPDLIVGVCGCMAAEGGIRDLLKSDFHYVSFTLEPNMLHKLPMLVFKMLSERKRSFILGEDRGDIIEGLPAVRAFRHKAWVSVMYGCNNFCSYCIVPYVRGRERSRDSGSIIKECYELVSSGVKEITLLGQNVNSYSSDTDFAGLLEMISDIPGDFIIRFITSHPKDVSDRLIRVMKDKREKIAPYFHLPLQSGSDRILGLMHRTYDREKFLSTVEALREAVPDICLSTDVIVGFPTETEEDFKDTLDILERARFDMAYSFLYSPREGTPAAKMDGQIAENVKSERMARLLRLQDRISYEKNQPYLGKRVRVLVDSVTSRGKNNCNARTDSNKLVHFQSSRVCVGDFAEVVIKKADAFNLIAEEI